MDTEPAANSMDAEPKIKKHPLPSFARILNKIKPYKHLLLIFFFWKIAIFLFLTMAYFSSPIIFNSWNFHYHLQYKEAFLQRKPSPAKILPSPFSHWDGQHYLAIAKYGYKTYAKVQPESPALYPLLPALIRLAAPLAGGYFRAGYLQVSLFCLLFFYFFYRISRVQNLPAGRCLQGFLLVLCFPTAFYLTTIYTEALFLSLLFGFLYYFQVKNSYHSIPFAILLPICRPQGLILPFALAVALLWQYLRPMEAKTSRTNLSLGLANVAGFAGGFAAMLAGIIPVASQGQRFWLLIYLGLVLVPALMGEGMAYSRYALLAFPFLAMTLVQKWRHNQPLIYGFTILMATLQGLFIYRFAINLWVA